MFLYLPEPADGLDFSFKISNDQTRLKVYIRNSSGVTARILNPLSDPLHESFEIIEPDNGITPRDPIACRLPVPWCPTLKIENGAVVETSTSFAFYSTQAGLYYGKATFFDPKFADHYRQPQEPVQPVDMRSLRFLVRVYPSGKYKLLKIVD